MSFLFYHGMGAGNLCGKVIICRTQNTRHIIFQRGRTRGERLVYPTGEKYDNSTDRKKRKKRKVDTSRRKTNWAHYIPMRTTGSRVRGLFATRGLCNVTDYSLGSVEKKKKSNTT